MRLLIAGPRVRAPQEAILSSSAVERPVVTRERAVRLRREEFQTYSSAVERSSDKREVRGSIPRRSIGPEQDPKRFILARWRSGSVPGS